MAQITDSKEHKESMMTKRIIAICLAVSFFGSASVFASRARNLVWGGGEGGAILGGAGDNGSFYVNDAYNIFYNPSYLVDGGEWATIEKDATGTGAQGAAGGFATKIMGFGVGFYFNRASADANPTSAAGAALRPLELLVAGDHGVKWGVGASYASNTVAARAEDKTDMDLTLRAGVQVAGLEPFAMFKVIGSNNAVAGADGNTAMAFGTKYRFGEWTPFAAWSSASTEDQNVRNNFGLGVGRNTKLGEGATLNYAIGYWRTRTVAALGDPAESTVLVPVSLSASGDITGWLTLRGGLVYNFASLDKDGSTAAAGDVTGRIGASINVGAVSFDWAVGSAGGGAADNLDGNNFDFANGLFSSGSLTYRM